MTTWLLLFVVSKVPYYPRAMGYLHPSPQTMRSSDDEEQGGRSPPLEVSDEECLRDHIAHVTRGELGREFFHKCIPNISHV